MRRMAGETSLFTGNRGMVDGDLLTLFFMAVKAEGVAFFENKLCVFRSMGLVAGITHSLFKGRMVHRPTPLQFRGLMAIQTEFVLLFAGLKRFGRGSRLMTRIALNRSNG